MEPQRLQKWLAHCGYGSRRACERLIEQGRVQVNGTPAQLGMKIDPQRDVITVDGKQVQSPPDFVYLMLHKPRGYVTTRRDPHAPHTVMELLRDAPPNLFPVGRLDADSEGLLLFTNDGALAHRLMHPRYKLPKTYRVWVRGTPSERALKQLREGVLLEDGVTAPAQVRLLRTSAERSLLEIVLREGRKRQIRRMCQALGYPVQRLIRIAIGDLRLPRDLPPGKWRLLSHAEIALLKSEPQRPSSTNRRFKRYSSSARR